MNLIHYLQNELITDNTEELTSNKLFLLTSQNKKYAKNIKQFITPSKLLNLFLKTKIIGISGTNGKTTTAFVLGYLLKKLGFNVAVQGTEGFYVNGDLAQPKTITTPKIFTTIKRIYKYKPDFFIMEVSSHAIAQNRIEGIKFSAKIFTSFSQDHLDYHHSMEEYKKVKESFFQDDAIKIVNGKIENSRISSSRFQRVNVDGYDFKMNRKNLYVLEKPIINDIPMAGEFNKMNFSLAIKLSEIISKKLNIPWNPKQTFDSFQVPGRMEIVSKNPLIVIDFAHTPDGMEKVISSIKGKKLVVFGAGGNRDKQKRPLMGKVADSLADYIIITNDNPRCEKPEDIINDIKKAIKKTPFEVIIDRKKAIKRAVELMNNFDAVLILGKGDEKFIKFCNKKVPFNDKKIVKEMLNLNI